MSEQNPPKFNSYEEMMEWVNNQPAVKAADAEAKKDKPKKATKKSSKKKAAPADPSSAMVESPAEDVWSTVHFYTRPGLSPQKTLNDAKEERKFRNDNVMVATHDHAFGEECGNCYLV